MVAVYEEKDTPADWPIVGLSAWAAVCSEASALLTVPRAEIFDW
jgi:hypothetical protein